MSARKFGGPQGGDIYAGAEYDTAMNHHGLALFENRPEVETAPDTFEEVAVLSDIPAPVPPASQVELGHIRLQKTTPDQTVGAGATVPVSWDAVATGLYQPDPHVTFVGPQINLLKSGLYTITWSLAVDNGGTGRIATWCEFNAAIDGIPAATAYGYQHIDSGTSNGGITSSFQFRISPNETTTPVAIQIFMENVTITGAIIESFNSPGTTGNGAICYPYIAINRLSDANDVVLP